MAIKLNKSNLVKNLVNRYKLVPLIENYIDKEGDFEWSTEFKPKEGDDAFHPSGDCLPSLYDLYWMAKETGTHGAVSTSLRKSFGVGHYWHAYLQEIVTRAGWADESAIERRGTKIWKVRSSDEGEEPLPYHWATGAGDIAPIEIPTWKGIVDIKTMNSFDFKRNALPEWAKYKYIAQLNMYMDFFEEEEGMIFAVNKDSPHDFKEFMVRRDQQLIDSIYRKWKFVGEALDANYEPTEKDELEFQLTFNV